MQRVWLGCALVLGLAFAFAGAPAGATHATISAVAGGGTGDGHLATAVSVAGAGGVAPTSDGGFFFTHGSRIRFVDPAGILSTLAGTAGTGFSGDGGPAAAARFSRLGAIVRDPAGNLYVADTDNRRVRMIRAADGVVVTVAGTGSDAPSGDGGPATQAGFASIFDIAFENGSLYLADYVAGTIRRVRPDGIVSTVAGTGVHGFSGDGGPATAAQLDHPGGVGVRDGVVYIVDTWNHRVRRIDTLGTITTIAGLGRPPVNLLTGHSYGPWAAEGVPATLAHLLYPHDVAFAANDDVLVADTFNQRIRRIDSDGRIWTVAGLLLGYGPNGDGGPARLAAVNFPEALAVGPTGRIYFNETDWGRYAIRAVEPNGTIRTVAGNNEYAHGGDGGPATGAMMYESNGIDVGPDGSLYIADEYSNRVRKVDPSGTITTVAGGRSDIRGLELWGPRDVAVDAAGNVYISELYNHRVSKLAPDGTLTVVAGGREIDRQLWLGGYGTGFVGDGLPATTASLVYPYAVDVDPAGNLFIADTLNYRVRRVDAASGVISTIAGTGTWGDGASGGSATQTPIGRIVDVEVDPATGVVLIADASFRRVRRIDPSGILTTVAGTGGSGSSGDGGPAVAATLAQPTALLMDRAGGYLIGTGDGRIRHVDAAGTIRTIAGGGSGFVETDGVAALGAALPSLDGLAFDAAGGLLVSTRRVRRIASPLS